MRKRAIFGVLLLSSGLLIACGGGGGGGGGSPYSGLRTPAVIIDNNYDDVARQAYQGADFGASSVPLAPAVEGDGGLPASVPYSLAKAFLSPAREFLRGRAAVRGPAPRAVYSDTITIGDGHIPEGTMTLTASINDQTGDFWGSFTYANWHGDSGGTIDGSGTFNGHFNLVSEEIDRFHFSFASVTITDAGVSGRISGTVDLEIGASSASVTENLFLTNLSTGKTVWIDGFALTVTEGSGTASVTIDGRIYLPDFGYVDVTTPTPLVYSVTSSFPSAGVMEFAGSNGAMVRMTVNGTTDYTVELDEAPGDGAFEHALTVSWA